MRERSSKESHASSSKGKRSKNLLDGSTFRISKINLNSGGSDLRLTSSHFRRSMLLEPTVIPLEKTAQASHARLQLNISNAATRVKAALTVAERKQSQSPKRNATVIIERASTITPLNAYLHVLIVLSQTNHENESKEFRLEPAKTSRKEIGPVRAYAANTRASTFTDINCDRLSIVTNLQPIGKVLSNMQISFFAIYDGHNGAGCAQYLRDNMHVYLSKDEDFPESMAEALSSSLRKIQTDYLKVAEKKGDCCGSNALVMVLVSNLGNGSTKCYVACVGNSRAVISRNCGSEVTALNVDHSPHTDREYRRIMKAGGSVYTQKSSQIIDQATKNTFRVIPGKLKCSRAIGNYELKSDRFGYRTGIIISDPEVESYEVEDGDFILMASDGVFDALTSSQAAKAVWASALANRRQNIHEQAGQAVTAVLYQALRKLSNDYMSAILVCLTGFEQTIFGEQSARLPGRDTP